MSATSLILPEPLNSSWLERYLQSPFKQPLEPVLIKQVVQGLIGIELPHHATLVKTPLAQHPKSGNAAFKLITMVIVLLIMGVLML
ncbi:hypothetical protein [Herpetosiphon geysericola]|uniref:Uncharacterized protein n=1 Tax=Herpetosiphon geysericola TaxID=70996 RepID=A0A0P6Z0N5_9CHLR|nr:hypothetical protein [Herpetosiphon geysericola]KPL90444.1 hypothetical protein SE18_07535 [Herpetosiphon geysericola]